MGNTAGVIGKQGTFKVYDERKGSRTYGQTLTVARSKFLCMARECFGWDIENKMQARIDRAEEVYASWEDRPTVYLSWGYKNPEEGAHITETGPNAVFDEYEEGSYPQAGVLLPRKGRRGPRWTLITAEQYNADSVEGQQALRQQALQQAEEADQQRQRAIARQEAREELAQERKRHCDRLVTAVAEVRAGRQHEGLLAYLASNFADAVQAEEDFDSPTEEG